MTRSYRGLRGTDDSRRLSEERLFVKRETILYNKILNLSKTIRGRREPNPPNIFYKIASRTLN